MEKKYYLITMVLLLSLIISATLVSGENVKEESTNPKVTTPSYNDNSEKGVKQPTIEDLLNNLVFNDDIIIERFIEFENDYLAIGTKGDYPYIQRIRNTNQSLVVDEMVMEFNQIKGKIIDLSINHYYITASILNTENQVVNQNFFITNDQMFPYYKEQLTMNYSKGVTIEPKYIVIHETANTKAGADAAAHYKYWSTNASANASTHFVVDSTQIYQMLELNQMAWHVGDNKGYSDIVNSNTIGIEIAVNSDGNYDVARHLAIELTIKLMKDLNMDITQLKMHNEASGKLDPITMLNDPSLWTDFVNQVKIGIQN